MRADRAEVSPRHRSFGRRVFRRIVLYGLLVSASLIGLVALYVAFAPTPPDRFPVQTSYVFDRNGERLASLSAGENRQVVRLSNVSKWVPIAVVAAEDRHFYQHHGVDPTGILRALYQDLRHKGRRQGGSTITQQYVKNAYVGREASVLRKVKEAAIAVKLERRLSKDEILERYLNTIYFGRGSYGIEAAASAYYGVSSADLTLAQSAYLAALIRGPETTDVAKDPAKAAKRRTSVLTALVQTGAITDAERVTAEAVPLTGPQGVKARKPPGRSYDHPDVGAEWFVDAVRRDLSARYGEQVLQTQGLRVTTTLDLATQRAAFRAAYATVLPSVDDPSAAVVVLGHDGEVRAMVGGRDWARSKVNLAEGRDGGGLGRPAGSTFKPFVLAAVLRAGYSLESAFPGPAVLTVPAGDQGGADWVVRNAHNDSFATLNLVDATRLSVNTVFAQVITNKAIGPAKVADAAHDLGIVSPLREYASLALGTSEVSTLEMANAYLTLANHGERTSPTLISEVKTADGRMLKLDKPERKSVLKASEADTITSVLREVVRSGTGTAAALPNARIAGKTGTTNDSRDAWFVGYTPETCCVTAVWMGYPDGARPMGVVHGVRVSGGTLPARIFAATMRVAVPKTVQGKRFAVAPAFGGDLLPGSVRRKASVGAPSPAAVPPTIVVRSPVAVSGDPVETVGDDTGIDVGGGVDPVSPATAATVAPTVPPVVVSVAEPPVSTASG